MVNLVRKAKFENFEKKFKGNAFYYAQNEKCFKKLIFLRLRILRTNFTKIELV